MLLFFYPLQDVRGRVQINNPSEVFPAIGQYLGEIAQFARAK